LQNTKDVDLVNANKFGNQFDFKNPRSWMEAMAVLAFGVQLLLTIAGSVLSPWGIQIDISQYNAFSETLQAMMGLGGYRLAAKWINNRR
jgi:hypothetical protein